MTTRMLDLCSLVLDRAGPGLFCAPGGLRKSQSLRPPQEFKGLMLNISLRKKLYFWLLLLALLGPLGPVPILAFH